MRGGMGMGGGWGGGAPYGYSNFNHRPRFGGGNNPGNKPLSLTDVKDWLDKQQPFVLQSVLKHCREVLTNKHNVSVEDMSDWYGDPDTGVPETKTSAKSGGVNSSEVSVPNYDDSRHSPIRGNRTGDDG